MRPAEPDTTPPPPTPTTAHPPKTPRAKRKLNLLNNNSWHRDGGNRVHPNLQRGTQASSEAPDPARATDLAGATARRKNQEPDPHQAGRTASPHVYMDNKAHRDSARPKATHNMATRQNTICSPVGHTVHRLVHAPAKGGQREDEANPPRKKDNRGGIPHTTEQETTRADHSRSPPHPAKQNLPTRAGGGQQGRQPRTHEGEQNATKGGKFPARQEHEKHPAIPTLRDRETTLPSPVTGPRQ